MTPRTIRIVYTHDGNGWLVSAPALPGCGATGRGLSEARRNISAAVELLAPDAALQEEIKLPARIRGAIRTVLRCREQSQVAHARAQEAQREAARAIATAGLGLRDAGELLGLSHQAVKKILAKAPAQKTRAR